MTSDDISNASDALDRPGRRVLDGRRNRRCGISRSYRPEAIRLPRRHPEQSCQPGLLRGCEPGHDRPGKRGLFRVLRGAASGAAGVPERAFDGPILQV